MGFDRKEYEFLGEIGLGPTNIGCFINGMWKASGSEVSSVNPSNNQAMAKVAEASIGDYEEGMRACSEATKTWMNVWNPLGIVGVITAFNFPCAGGIPALHSYAGAPTTPLVTIAVTKLVSDVLEKNNLPGAMFTAFCGGAEIGQAIATDTRIALVSFTGSSKVGLMVQQTVSQRFGKCLLELSGNKAMIVMDDADISLALLVQLVSGARHGRRLYLHESIYENVLDQLIEVYKQFRVKDPLEKGTLGGKILTGGTVIESDGSFVQPTIVEIYPDVSVVKEELFGPSLEEAIEMNNSVPLGLSSSIFTRRPEVIFKWIGPCGSDCGIVNVNIPTNGAEIGGAFGGEKATGGGREAGSDSCEINYGKELPLAQGINFVQ
ncbi:Aldehyde dehydrogenase domain - like 10 [Theobroma cacao]|nr:Aldehyde dehydrogenase domain - like 10 [Theobroma cacao]